jgi:hypothetical protein
LDQKAWRLELNQIQDVLRDDRELVLVVLLDIDVQDVDEYASGTNLVESVGSLILGDDVFDLPELRYLLKELIADTI